MEKVTLLDLNFNTQEAVDGLDALIKRSIELAGVKKDLTNALKAEEASVARATAVYKEGGISQAEYNTLLDKSVKTQVDIKKSLLETSKELTENTSAVKANKTILDANSVSVEALRAKLALNTKELSKMSEAEISTTKAGIELTEQTKGLSDKLKTLEKSWGDNRRNVGNYAEGVEQAIKNTGGLSGATGQLVGGLTSGVSGVKAFNSALSANPIGAIVTVVLVLINTVERMMKRNDEMATNLKAAFAPFGAVFSRLLDGITNLMEGVVTVISTIAEKVTWLLDKLGLISDATKDAAASANKLAKESKAIFEAETDQIVVLAKIRREYENLKLLAADQNRTMTERVVLNKQALDKLKEMENAEIFLLARKRDQLVAQNKISYTNAEDRRKEQEAIAALDAKQAEYASKRKEVLAQMTGLEKTARDKNTADALSAASARKAAELKAAAEVESAKKTLMTNTLASMDANITTLQLKFREAQLAGLGSKAQLDNQDALSAELLSKEKYRLEQGLITQIEYDNKAYEAKIASAERLKVYTDEMAAKATATANERAAIDLANKSELEMQNVASDYERQILILDAKRAIELSAAEAVGADTSAIFEKYENYKETIAKKKNNARLEMAAELAGQLSDLMGSESKAGKAFAVAQATINTYLGASKALAQGGFLGIAQAAIVIGAGLKQVAEIVKVKKPDTEVKKPTSKFAKGGTIRGASHAAGGVTFEGDNGQRFEAEGGENVYILNKKASTSINALSALNQEHGGVSFAKSGLYKYANGGQLSTLSRSYAPTPQKADAVTLSDRSLSKLALALADAVGGLAAPVVSVQDINAGQRQVQVVENYATL